MATSRLSDLEMYAASQIGVPNAHVVIKFCKLRGIPCRLTAEALQSAMARMSMQCVSNYLDFVEAYEAAYTICSKRK